MCRHHSPQRESVFVRQRLTADVGGEQDVLDLIPREAVGIPFLGDESDCRRSRVDPGMIQKISQPDAPPGLIRVPADRAVEAGDPGPGRQLQDLIVGK